MNRIFDINGNRSSSDREESVKGRSSAGMRIAAGALMLLTAGLLLAGCGKTDEKPAASGAQTGAETQTGETADKDTEQNAQGGTEKPGTASEAEASGETEGAAGGLIHPVIEKHSNGNYAKKTDADVYIGYTAFCDSVVLSEEDAKRYPELAAALRSAQTDRVNNLTETYAFLKENAEEIVEYREDNGYYTELNAEYRDGIVRLDENVLCIHTSYSDYTGGAHGYYYDFGAAYDIATGKKLTLGDIVESEEDFRKAVTEKLEYTLDNEYQTELDTEELAANLDGLFGRGKYSAPEYGAPGWVLGINGVTVYFPPYSLGAYALGQQEVLISFEEYPELIKKQYAEVPSSYIVPLRKWSDNYYDLDGDGRLDRLTVEADYESESYTPENYDAFTKLKISINGTETVLDTYTFDGYAMYLAVNDGRSSLYFITQEENDYSLLRVYDLGGSAPREVGEYHGYEALIGYEYDDTDGDEESTGAFTEGVSVARTLALTDPGYMALSSRLDMLGTYDGWRICRADASGVPQSNDLYNAVVYYPITALRDIELEVTDSEGTETGEPVTVRKGTELNILKTDGEKIVILTDGSNYYRATIDASDWPRKVNGIPEDEAFDGICYAG